jgi:hypothetical protein
MVLSGCAESIDTLSASAESAESIELSGRPAESMILSALFGHVITIPAAATKKMTISDTVIGDRQQCLNGAANWSAAKNGQVLPHFEHIVSGASMPPCPIAAVF